SATAWPLVSAPIAATIAMTAAPDADPTSDAPAFAARPPERAAKKKVNAVNSSGARLTQKAAPSSGIPRSAADSARSRCTGTRWPSCQSLAVAGHSADQAPGSPKANSHRSVNGARIAPSPTAAATSASTAARAATITRCIAVRGYPAAASDPVSPPRARPHMPRKDAGGRAERARLLDRVEHEDRDLAVGALRVVLVRRVGRDGARPPLVVFGTRHLARVVLARDRSVLQLDARVRLHVPVPGRGLGR